tara:strand:- start:367 stop:1347 length:981 start_codon:yes stop_codon:yes gene_type:complete
MDPSEDPLVRQHAIPWTATTTLPISKGDIGKFIGTKGILVRKHVINRARANFAKSLGVDFSEVPSPHITVKVMPAGTYEYDPERGPKELPEHVVAEYSATTSELLAEISNCITTHIEHINAVDRPIRAERPKPKNSKKKPTKVSANTKKPTNSGVPRIYHLNFKTQMDDHLVGKYIGSGGKNCKLLSGDLERITKDMGASSFRVRIVQQDIYEEEKRTPPKFFLIKNEGSDEVFIHVSAKFSGNPRDLFLAIKKRMIESVVSLNDFSHDNSHDLFIHETEYPTSSKQELEMPVDDSGCYMPESPTPSSTHSSPRYSPSSPTTTKST